MSETIAEARYRRARCWLIESQFRFYEFVRPYEFDVTMPDMFGVCAKDGSTVCWHPIAQTWEVFSPGGDEISVHSGTQPEFAVFLRHLREGKVTL